MKKTLPLHLIWLAVAVGTYFLGTHRARQDGDSSPGSADGRVAGGGASLLAPGGSGARRGAVAGGDTPGAPGEFPSGAGVAGGIDELVRAATTPGNLVARSHAMSRILAALTAENAKEVLGAMYAAGADDQQIGLLVYAWGTLDGPAALAFADEIGDQMNDEERFGYESQVLKGWASADPDGAIAHVDRMAGDERVEGYRWNLVEGLADGSLERATAYVVDRGKQGDRAASRYMDGLTERMLRQAPLGDAIEWAGDLPAGELRAAALRRVATDYVEESPEEAAAWAATMVDEDHGPRVIHEVGDEWAERDPEAAVGWLETLPDGEAKASGMQAALIEWVKRGDPVAASEYLAAMPASAERDHAVSGFAGMLAHSDPASAVTWAESIADADVRQEVLVDTGRLWMHRDPGAAGEWLQTSGLEAGIVETIRTRPIEADYHRAAEVRPR